MTARISLPRDRRSPPLLTKRERYFLAQALNQVWADHTASSTNLEINFVDEDEMRALHRDFLQDDSPTDVITFDLGETPEGWRIAVITICVPVARRYAERYHVKLNQELHRLIIHGALHLLGYDDHTPTEKRQMRYQENKILRRIIKPGLP